MTRLLAVLLAGFAVLALASPASAAKPGAQIVQFKSGGSSSSEGTSPVRVPIILSQKVAPAQSASVLFQTNGGTATASPDATCSGQEDYIPVPPTPVVFGPGQNQLNSPDIVVCDNNRFENSESVELLLSAPSAPWSLGPKQKATLTITDNDPAPTITIDDSTPAAVTEGGNLVFDVHVAGSSLVPTSVQYQALSGLNSPLATVGLDFPATTGSLAWAPGDTSDRQITLPTTDDSIDELDGEDARMRLQNVINGSITDATGVGLINDNDIPELSISDGSTPEGNDGVTFNITLDGPAVAPVAVSWATADDTATGGTACDPGVDYITDSGTENFVVGDTTEAVVVQACEDGDFEGDETFDVNLSSPTGAVIDDGLGVGTIEGDGDTTTSTFMKGAPLALPDGVSTSSVLAVPNPVVGDVTVTDVDAVLNLSHTFPSDLLFTLENPDGTTAVILGGAGGGADVSAIDITLDDEASAAYDCVGGPALATASYKPTRCPSFDADPMSALDGGTAIGNWTLGVSDLFLFDGGTLHDWGVTLTMAD